jgi:hypothetical protein
MPVGYETVDYSRLELALKRAQDVHSGFQYEDLLADGIDAHFVSRVRRIGGGQVLDMTSKYWRVTDYGTLDGYIVLPKDCNVVSAYSRRAFVYPQVYAWTALPDMRRIGGETYFSFYIGIENGANAANGIASFLLTTDAAGVNRLHVIVGPLHGLALLAIDAAKPSDFSTAKHHYRIIHTRSITFFMIDQRIRAMAIQCAEGAAVKVKENVRPYSIALVSQMPAAMKALVELLAGGRTTPATEDFYAPLSPAWFRVSDGKDVAPLQLPLYLDNSDTRVAGYSLSSGTLVTHPIPAFGYSGKTVYFMADQSSTSGGLTIDVLTLSGNWRTYDSLTYSANTLLVYPISGDAVLVRLTYTPASYPATILEGEVVLR